MKVIDSILSDIGMKSYQWQLFFVCGSGWIADNMWLQGISAVLPKVQQEFKLSNELAGLMITIAMLGMMGGSTLWGYLGDRIGRKPAFTLTLLITFIFGSLSALSNSFSVLCVLLFVMGSGVGGNLPVDGALFLEFMPPEKHGLLTLLSIFWPVGSLIASLLAWVFIPNYDQGWRYVFLSFGIITLLMVLSRTIFFKFYESPKFLVASGRYEAAFQVLQNLAEKNQVELEIDFEEFKEKCQIAETAGDFEPCEIIGNDTISALETQALVQESSSNPAMLQRFTNSFQSEPWSTLFSPQYRQTTILLWCIWALVSFGYAMFNGLLAKILEKPGESEGELYAKYLLINSFGIPGSILGCYLVDSHLGRKGTMVLSTFGTAIALYFSTLFTGFGAITGNCIAYFLQNIMWGVIYAYTPEVFIPSCRGTAVGIASSFSKISGSIAPVVAGALLNISSNLPLVVASVTICIASVCMIMLPIETKPSDTLNSSNVQNIQS